MREGQLPREILEGIHLADWNPDGSGLAIVREVHGRTRLEFPLNTVLFETSGWISDVRFSPEGDHIAFVNHPVSGLGGGAIFVTPKDGTPRALAGDWDTINGLAWTPSGDEIWFTASDANGIEAARAIDLAGRMRVLVHGPGTLRLLDISPDARVLIRRDDTRLEALGSAPGDSRERNWSWLDWSLARDLSADGRRLLLVESGDGVGAEPAVSYIRASDGSPATPLGVGSALALSPDGQRALTIANGRLVLVPLGIGDPITLPYHGTLYHPAAGFFPDGRQVVFTGSEPGRGPRLFVQSLAGGPPKAITPEGFRLSSPASVSPDGLTMVAEGEDEALFLVRAAGGQPEPLPGSVAGEAMARWDLTGRAVFVFERRKVPAEVFRLSLDGHRERWRTLTPADLTGATVIHRLVMTPRGDGYAYTLERHLSDMYIARFFPRRPLLSSIWWWLRGAR
jgi:dipeptidyl aminopeptidase/acylaminoacyl peptidase